MMKARRLMLAVLLLLVSFPARAGEPVAATVETTLTTLDGQIRQFALDGDAATYFASEKGPSAEDHFTIVLDELVSVKSIEAVTGRPDGERQVVGGTLEVSPDGRTFQKLTSFADGKARGGPVQGAVRAIRIKPGASDSPIAIRELSIASDPPLSVFKYPVEFVVSTADAPELKEWAEKAARACERAYPMINAELASDGFQPPHVIRLTLSKDYRGVAGTSRDRIVGSVEYFRKHPDDVGAMVHETVHVVQAYRRRNNPSWLVEGVADYVRFFKYEPGKLGRINSRTAHYNNSYRVSAAFLAYLVEKYDKEIVRKLNAAMREGRYDDNLIQRLTGKPQGELDDEWRATLHP
jgi:Peptidase of plants and bacteria